MAFSGPRGAITPISMVAWALGMLMGSVAMKNPIAIKSLCVVCMLLTPILLISIYG